MRIVSVSVGMGATFSGQWEPPERLRRDPFARGLHRRPIEPLFPPEQHKTIQRVGHDIRLALA
jgi:hypothetical protein